MALKSVVLPAPFGPMRPVIVPAAIRSDTPSTAFMAPKLFVTSRTASTTGFSDRPSWPAPACVNADPLACLAGSG
jgi:hypothetical protein